MSASVLSDPASIVNYGLAKAGYRLRIGSLFDGSMAAKKALDVYGQTRDALLRLGDWNFALRNVAAVASGGTAPLPWTSSFAYPSDCLRVRSLYDAAASADPYNPLPTTWTVADDPGHGTVLWARSSSATINYVAQVTNPTSWEPLFIEALGAALVENFRSLAEKDDANFAKLAEERLAASTQIANETVG